jgi:2-polyprenyl-6-methoxyphenol hydroxylase-like FAD-dependent oxidoreductase
MNRDRAEVIDVMDKQTDVIIIGAGPTGLALACQLVRYGVPFVILEKNDGVTPYSKAVGVHARTLEIYEQMDLAAPAVAAGAIAGKARLLVDGEQQAELDLSNLGAGLSAYPYMLLLEQSKNEQLLYEYLKDHGKEVHWKSELENFSQTGEGVTAQIKSNGAAEAIAGTYLVGCDGARSSVRQKLGLAFTGSTFERIFYVADTQIDWQFSHDALHICLSKDALLLFFPLKGEKRYRIVGTFPEEFSKEEGDILYEEIERRIKEQAKLELDIHDVEWFSTYKVHTRHVSSFSAGRCFLAGDAAHIHTPAGAQGMNTGIQDGYNLAWKLALSLQGKANEKLLATYNEERLENARNLLQTTDRIFQLGAGPEWPLAFLRMNVVPSLARFILSIDSVKKFIFPRLSQIGINYRHSSLSRHEGDENFEVKAGDRMPYFLIDDQSVYDELRQPKFHFVLFNDTARTFQELEMEITQQSRGLVDFNEIAISPRIAEIFGTDEAFCLLLRPDNYIGFISKEISAGAVHNYLSNVIES